MPPPTTSRVHIGECPRCGGTKDDGGFLACRRCEGRDIVEVVEPMDDATRAVLARDRKGVAEAERLGWVLLDAARPLTSTVIHGLAWRVEDWQSWSTYGRTDELFARADAATVAAIEALGYGVNRIVDGHLVLVAPRAAPK